MTADRLSAKHVFEKCFKCRLIHSCDDKNFVCGLHHESIRREATTLRRIAKRNNLDLVDIKCEGREGAVALIQVMREISKMTWPIQRGHVGFSTGCLYQYDIGLVEKLKAYLKAGATVLELAFRAPEALLAFEYGDEEKSKFAKFDIVTIHAPWEGIRYFDGSGGTDPVMRKLVSICQELSISGIVFHPDIVDNFTGLEIVGLELPVLIENMDYRKDFCTTPEDIAKVKADYDFGFVLDLEHVYEHDQSMGLANEMVEVMGDRLSHLHASGFNVEYNHAPLHVADNWEVICETLRTMSKVPVILEGDLSLQKKNLIL